MMSSKRKSRRRCASWGCCKLVITTICLNSQRNNVPCCFKDQERVARGLAQSVTLPVYAEMTTSFTVKSKFNPTTRSMVKATLRSALICWKSDARITSETTQLARIRVDIGCQSPPRDMLRTSNTNHLVQVPKQEGRSTWVNCCLKSSTTQFRIFQSRT